MDDFLRRWDSASKKQAIIRELEEIGVLLEPLTDEVGKDFGAFDLVYEVEKESDGSVAMRRVVT